MQRGGRVRGGSAEEAGGGQLAMGQADSRQGVMFSGQRRLSPVAHDERASQAWAECRGGAATRRQQARS